MARATDSGPDYSLGAKSVSSAQTTQKVDRLNKGSSAPAVRASQACNWWAWPPRREGHRRPSGQGDGVPDGAHAEMRIGLTGYEGSSRLAPARSCARETGTESTAAARRMARSAARSTAPSPRSISSSSSCAYRVAAIAAIPCDAPIASLRRARVSTSGPWLGGDHGRNCLMTSIRYSMK
jgi:hypothetical protein